MHAIKIELCNQYIMQFNELSNMLQIASIYKKNYYINGSTRFDLSLVEQEPSYSTDHDSYG